jgi:dihydroxyacetone kinase-like protein
MALTACTVPAAGKPGFELSETEMEMGIGIHGEPGTYKSAIKTADEIVNEMMDKILTDMPIGSSDEVVVLVNGFGGTPVMELYVLNNRVYDIITEKGAKIYHTLVGDYMTSIEMAGCSVTVLKLDAEMKKLYDAKACTIAFHA